MTSVFRFLGYNHLTIQDGQDRFSFHVILLLFTTNILRFTFAVLIHPLLYTLNIMQSNYTSQGRLVNSRHTNSTLNQLTYNVS